MELLFSAFTSLFGFLVNSWVPVVLAGPVLWEALRAPPLQEISNLSHRLLLSAEITAAVMWVFLYGEHWSHGRVPLFDYGAPLLTLVAVVAIPLLGAGALLKLSTLIERRGGIALSVLSLPFLVMSLVPGFFFILFYLGMMFSDR